MDYQAVLTTSIAIRTSLERATIWQRYTEMHMAVARSSREWRPALGTDYARSRNSVAYPCMG